MNYLRKAWKKIFSYTGRTSRKEYWMTAFWSVVTAFLLVAVALLSRWSFGLPDFIQEVVLGWLFYILVVVLTLFVIVSLWVFIALSVRRIHDIGLSGWWILIGLVPFFGAIVVFVFTVIAGNGGDNKYGTSLAGSVVVSNYPQEVNPAAPLSSSVSSESPKNFSSPHSSISKFFGILVAVIVLGVSIFFSARSSYNEVFKQMFTFNNPFYSTQSLYGTSTVTSVGSDWKTNAVTVSWSPFVCYTVQYPANLFPREITAAPAMAQFMTSQVVGGLSWNGVQINVDANSNLNDVLKGMGPVASSTNFETASGLQGQEFLVRGGQWHILIPVSESGTNMVLDVTSGNQNAVYLQNIGEAVAKTIDFSSCVPQNVTEPWIRVFSPTSTDSFVGYNGTIFNWATDYTGSDLYLTLVPANVDPLIAANASIGLPSGPYVADWMIQQNNQGVSTVTLDGNDFVGAQPGQYYLLAEIPCGNRDRCAYGSGRIQAYAKSGVFTILSASATTTEWKTYTDSKYGFQISYPPNLILSSDTPPIQVSPQYVASGYVAGTPEYYIGTMSVQDVHASLRGFVQGVSHDPVSLEYADYAALKIYPTQCYNAQYYGEQPSGGSTMVNGVIMDQQVGNNGGFEVFNFPGDSSYGWSATCNTITIDTHGGPSSAISTPADWDPSTYRDILHTFKFLGSK